MSFRTCLRTGWAAAMLLLLAGIHPATAAVDVPIALELTAPTSTSPDQTVMLQGRVVAGAALTDISIQLVPEGAVRLMGAPVIALGEIGRGGSVPFTVPVTFTAHSALAGDAGVRFRVTARHAETGLTFEKNDGVFGVMRAGRIHTAVGDVMHAHVAALEADLADGSITGEEMDRQKAALRSLPGTRSQTPVQGFAVPAELQAVAGMYNSVIATGIDADAMPGDGSVQNTASGTVTYTGNLSWEDSNGNTHAGAGMRAVLYQRVLGIPVATASTICDAAGNYSVSGFILPGSDTWVEWQTENSLISLQAMGSGGYYFAESGHHFDPPDGSNFVENFVVDNANPGPAAGLLVTTTYQAGYTTSLNGGALAQLRVEWPGSSTTAFYSPSLIFINLRPLDRWAYDVAHHEYGHYIMDMLNFEDNPGGPHNIGDCISDVHSDNKSEGIRLAWGEGWPTFFGTAGQVFQNLAALSIPTLGDVTYTDTEAGNFSYSLESNSGPPLSQDNRGRGEDNEIAVQRILWDLVDGNSEGHDNTQITSQALFDIAKPSGVTSLSGYWALVRAAAASSLADIGYGAITTDHLVGPRLSGPANNAVVSPSANKTFSWNADVGCPSSYSGDGFTLRFFTPGGTQVLAIGGLGTTSTTISDGQLATLIAAGHNLIWAVEGSHSGSPATGPYLGENRQIQVDRPPVADAGPDQTVECTSPTTTAVLLNGTGSSDPDGDPLTYTWSAPGVTFDDDNSATPTGNFAEGTHTVTLTVSDGILTDTDQVQITIVDTTPPVVSCPANLTVECNSHCDATLGGVPATDPAVVAWLATFTATDVCDDNLTTTLPTPACFPLGETEVTFTATDDDGNSSSCTRKVIVVDTTPPVVTVDLDRASLWPPNHKMVVINATVVVTDACDPNPTFQLWNITSNEPANDIGDGNTEPDIAGATYFTPDVQFSLRSERMGPRPGRIYTVTYRGFDGSGNSTDAFAYVAVAHDQSLVALPADGWNEDGTGFAAGAEKFALVIRSIGDDVMMDSPDASVDGLAPAIVPVDAATLVRRQILVGNTAGALQPERTVHMDADGDGLLDVVAWYRVADALAIRDRSDLLDGPVGVHAANPMENYLATSIFALGAPITLPPIPVDDGMAAPAGEETEGPAADADPVGDLQAPRETSHPSPVESGPVASAPMRAQEAAPTVTQFEGVFPNPIPGRATMAFSLAREEAVELAIYNVAGAMVRSIHRGALGAGRYAFTWDGRDAGGQQLAGGIYFVRFRAGGYLRTTKSVLMH